MAEREVNGVKKGGDASGQRDRWRLSGLAEELVFRGLLRAQQLLQRGQPVVSGAAAFAAMWRAIPVLRPLGWIARFPPMLWLIEAVYRLFLRFRPRLQRIAHRIQRNQGPTVTQ